ncbi:MAG: 30S ribosomal protein S13 [Deltaproteobacteria bacterium]|jgi:small subunit ribosomal protein S13|nr:30S ribosomal protein S13 [Deltaproteobacteria bacterium]
MPRIAGVDLPKDKRMEIALTYVYGIGRKTAQDILDAAGVPEGTSSDNVSESQVKNIRDIIDDKYTVEGDLRREINMNIKRLMDLRCYRGLRHMKHLPVRGQRTHTNARTRKGPKRLSVRGKK